MLDQNQARLSQIQIQNSNSNSKFHRHIGSARLAYSSLVPKMFGNYSRASYGCTQEQGPPSEPSYRE